MKIFELFDRPVPYDMYSSGSDYEATFEIDGREFVVEIEMLTDTVMNIEFVDDEGSQSLTGRGDAIAVFSTVSAIIKKAVSQIQPEQFSFSASATEPSRVKLYKRLSQVMGKDLGYDVQISKSADPKYILTKQ